MHEWLIPIEQRTVVKLSLRVSLNSLIRHGIGTHKESLFFREMSKKRVLNFAAE